MSKKHRRKHYTQIQPLSVKTVQTPTQTNAVSLKDSSVYAAHQDEYKNISSDLIKVVIVNGLFLVGVLVLYFINKSNPFLDSWYNWLF